MSARMRLPVYAVAFLLFLLQGYESQQIPEALVSEEDLGAQVLSLQRNISELWTYIYQLRTAVTTHLNHLRQHQLELENTVHGLTHHGGGQSHDSHSGEHHSHGDDHHSHGDDHHSHGDDHHSHGDDHHSHGQDPSPPSHDHPSHGDDHHHHSEEQHSHDDGQHSHSGENHGSSSHHHESHTDHGHGEASHAQEIDHHHHNDHNDSHEKEDQQTQQGADPLPEPVVTPVRREPHSGHPPNGHSHGSHVGSPSGSFKPLPLMNHQHHHHHHDNQPDRNRSRVLVLPKYTEYDLYDFAVCNVQPNRAIPENQQQEVNGQVSFWQRKAGGALNIHVSLRGFNMGHHHGEHLQQQEQNNETPNAGHKHGFHVHALADLSTGCNSAGPHYNPKSATHAGPNALVRHVGDLGNIECDDMGVANIVFTDEVASLTGQYSIVGKSIVIHSNQDDLGLGGNDESLRTGNAGTRIACCVIQKVEKLPIRLYRAIKTARQYQNY